MRRKYIKIFLIELIIVIVIFSYFFPQKKLNNPILQKELQASSVDNLKDIDDKSKLYLELEQGLLEGKETIDLKFIALFREPSEIFHMLETISNENPEVMYYRAAEYKLGKLNLFYSKSKEELKEHQKSIRKVKIEFISNYISEDMTDYDKALAIHDYIVKNSKYDEKLFIEGSVPPESYTAYGVLALGVGVCEGYAKSMKYLLDGVGMDSVVVVGQSKGDSHAWNLVDIDGEYYHIDSTWDDPVTNDGTNVLRYNFFNLNDEEIMRTHTWNNGDYPPAEGEYYNYFNYNNLVVYGEEELKKEIRESLLKSSSELWIKMKNYKIEELSLSKIVEEIVYNNHKLIKLTSYSYSVDEEHGIISFQFYYH